MVQRLSKWPLWLTFKLGVNCPFKDFTCIFLWLLAKTSFQSNVACKRQTYKVFVAIIALCICAIYVYSKAWCTAFCWDRETLRAVTRPVFSLLISHQLSSISVVFLCAPWPNLVSASNLVKAPCGVFDLCCHHHDQFFLSPSWNTSSLSLQDQAWPTCGPGATCSPLSFFHPARQIWGSVIQC